MTDLSEILSKAALYDIAAALHIQLNGFIDEATVERITGLSRAERYRMRMQGTFPPMHTIKGKVKGWRIRGIQHWLESQSPAPNR